MDLLRLGKHKHADVIVRGSFRATNISRSRCLLLGDDGDSLHCLSLSKATDVQRNNPSFPEQCNGPFISPFGFNFSLNKKQYVRMMLEFWDIWCSNWALIGTVLMYFGTVSAFMWKKNGKEGLSAG